MYGAGLCQAQLYRCWQKQNEEGQTTDLEHGPCTFARPAAGVGRTRQLPLEKITLCCPHVYRPRARTVHETLAVAIRMAGRMASWIAHYWTNAFSLIRESMGVL
jgi:hypothetical protein